MGAVGTFDSALGKDVLGHYLTGVVVVTALSPSGPVGFTCQTFGSLSIESATVFFAAASTSKSWLRMQEVGLIGINILRDDQALLARVFATSGTDKFADVSWFAAPNGSPLLEGSLAYLEGTLQEIANHGDHDIAIAGIDYADTRPGAPLAYFRSGFHELA